ncbi:MAG: amidohydrolase [Gammaproteobacteria bacterium]|nr:amidohydrolase [Gammaproteobacteria bacterium]
MKVVLTNIGTMISGDWRQPFIDGDALVMDNGRLGSIGTVASGDIDSADLVVDAGGMTAIPGIIDSHVHITFGDYTPRQKTVGFLESYLHGGITSCISASEIHVPGRPVDPAGIAALALAAQRCFQTYRPGGMRVYAGSVIMEPGLADAHFESLAAEGVWLAKVGFGAFAKPVDVTPIVRSAQRHGFKVMCHTGGASIPGSAPITADDLITMQPDIAGHCNGGPVALSDAGLERVVKESTMALQIAQAGNIRSAALTIRLAEANDQFDRVLISSDTPTGTGVMPLGVIKSLTEMSTLTEVEPERIIATATGNCTRVYDLDAGLLKPDMAADVTLIDASQGCTQSDALAAMRNGDIPAVAAVFSNGIPRFIGKSRNTPPPTRQLRITKNKVLQQFKEEGVHHCC